MLAHLRNPPRALLGAVCVLVTLFTPGLAPPPLKASTALYTVADLGTLACCPESIARSINAHGDVVGEVSIPEPFQAYPFIYENGRMRRIGRLPGYATGINDAGQATGYVSGPDSPVTRAFVYQHGVYRDLGSLRGYPHDYGAVAYAINNRGTIVGESNVTAFVYEHGRMRALRRGVTRFANAINDAGDIVGLFGAIRPTPNENHAFLSSGHDLIDIGTLDGDPNSGIYPAGINMARQIVGTAWKNGNSEQRAFIWQDGVFQELLMEPPPGYPASSAATGINNRGDVVGESSTFHFVYRDGVMIDLNSVIEKDENGFPFVFRARAINDAGQIAGQCNFGGAAPRACVLTPIAR